MRSLVLISALAMVAASGVASAASVQPIGYTNAGDAWYPDDLYGTPLPGGGVYGDLTDGVIPTDHWNPPYEARIPFVGYNSFNPQISFSFQPGTTLGSAVLYFDDYGGGFGVTMPDAATITINGTVYTGDVTHNGTGASPISFSFGSGVVTDTAVVNITRGGQWTFMSEAAFATPAPEPGEWAMMGTGLGLVGAIGRRRSRRNASD